MDIFVQLHKVEPLLEKNRVKFAGVFGSFARGEETAESDVDLLVDFRSPKSLLELVALERELSETLRRKVDLVTEKSLSPYLKDAVLRDLRVFYGRKG
jgi:predicted nucleotidyltransferase